MSRVHTLKTDPTPFQETDDGLKSSEVRYDDRGFHVGDYLILQETVSTGMEMAAGLVDHPLEYTGSHILCRVTHIHRNQGVQPLWAVLSHVVLDKLTPSAIEDCSHGE